MRCCVIPQGVRARVVRTGAAARSVAISARYVGCPSRADAVGADLLSFASLILAADDVAAALADVAVGLPANGTIEIAGPERFGLDDLIRRFLAAMSDARQVVADAHARYFGAELNDQSLTPGDSPRVGRTRFADWLRGATVKHA